MLADLPLSIQIALGLVLGGVGLFFLYLLYLLLLFVVIAGLTEPPKPPEKPKWGTPESYLYK